MKFFIKILAIICLTFLFSCVSDSPSPDVNQIKDDFSYLVVNSLGKLNKIGNNTGLISTYSEFNGVNSASFLNLNTVTSNSNKIFLAEYLPPVNKLFVFDKSSNQTTSKTLVFPNTILGDELVLISLQWNEPSNQLFGIITNPDIKELCYFVTINPTTFEVKYPGISFNQKGPLSTFINGTKFYSSCYNGNTIEVNLANNTSKSVFFNSSSSPISFTRAATTSNNILYGMKGIIGNINGVSLIKFDLSNSTSTDILPNEIYGLINVAGKGFIDNDNNQFVNIVNQNNKFGVLKYNISSNSTEFVSVNNVGLDNNMVIIEKVSS
jgi:hypothetical protein